MFDFGEHGYHEYRATQSGASDKNAGWAGAVLLFLVLPLGIFLVYFIGAFLYYSWVK
jgi:hypothetical protein